jgi:hypothetical protein
VLRAATVFALLGFAVAARAVERPLTVLPDEDIKALAAQPLAEDLALIESYPDGTEKQVTLFAYIAAPPAIVRAVIGTPGDYRKFIPNLSQSTAEPQPDGTIKQVWKIELPVSSFDGINLFTILPDAILLRAIDPNDEATYRYETHASGAGTLLVQYGYTDVKHSNAFVRAFLRRQPMMEHGLALSAQLMFVSAMRAEAERRAGPVASKPSLWSLAATLARMKQRGQVALMSRESSRPSTSPSAPGRLDKRVQVMERVYASKSAILTAIGKVDEYPRFVPGVDRAAPRAAGVAGAVAYYLEMSTPIVGWATTYEMRALGDAGFDGAGISGDLGGSRFRWLVSDGSGTPIGVNVSYTVEEELARSSFVLRQLFKFQPSLEYGIEVAIALVWMRAIRGRAEGWH